MDSHPPPQPRPAPGRYGSLPPASDPGRPLYTAPPGPAGSSNLPYRPYPNPTETSYPPPPASEPPMTHRPPATAPVQLPPAQTSSTTSYNPPPSHLTHASPRPISDPLPDFGKHSTSIPAGPNPNPLYGPPSNQPVTFPPPPQQQPQPQPASALTQPPFPTPSLNTARAAAQSALQELLALRRQQVMVVGQTNGVLPTSAAAVNGTGTTGGAGKGGKRDQAMMAGERVRAQTGLVLRELEGLQARVGEVVRGAEGGRWRRVLVGGVV